MLDLDHIKSALAGFAALIVTVFSTMVLILLITHPIFIGFVFTLFLVYVIFGMCISIFNNLGE
jgi:cobalamin biosynthesis protein CobD/CbiB